MPGRSRRFRGPDDPRIKRVLCIAAHPDDAEYFCAGTIMLLARAGATVDLVLATSGDKGAREAGIDGPALAAVREGEQLAAAAKLGLQHVEFLRHADAGLVESLELRGELVREIRRSRPDLLLTFDPTPGYRQHPDHRVVGRMALDAAWPCARDRLTYPEAGDPPETAQGTFMAGWPVTSKGAVFGIISSARATYSSRGASAAGMRVAFSGSVGRTSRSTSASARSYAPTRLRARFWARA